MRTTTLALLLCLAAGCTKNIEQLQTLKGGLEHELAEKKKVAERLNERRRELEALRMQVVTGLKEAGMTAEDLHIPAPVPAESVAVPLPAPPPVSTWEGSRGAELRLQIAELNARIAELDKIVAEVRSLEAQKTVADATLKAIADLNRAHGTNQANVAQ